MTFNYPGSIHEEVLIDLQESDTCEEILEAVSKYSQEPRSPQSMVVLSVAGDMVAERVDGDYYE